LSLALDFAWTVGDEMNPSLGIRELNICYVASQNVLEDGGGIRSFTLSALNWLRNRDVSVSLVYREGMFVRVIQDFPSSKQEESQLDFKNREGRSNSRSLRLPSYFMYFTMQLLFCLLAVISVLKINKSRRISVIHAQDTHYGALAAIIASGLLGVPVITHAHGVMYLFNVGVLSRGVQLLVHKLVMKYSTLTISVSEATKRFLVTQFGAEPRKVPVIPVGIKVQEFASNIGKKPLARQILGINEKAFVVGYFGRLSVQKNVKSLLLAVADIVNLKKIENILLLIIGVGDEEQSLKALAKRLGTEKHVIFAGYVESLPIAIQAMDIFVLPSFLEGYPTVVLEAKAAGKAIVASNIPGIPEIIENERTGLLVNPRETSEIEAAILKLYKDPNLTGRLARNALSEVTRHDENEVFQQLLHTYLTLSGVT